MTLKLAPTPLVAILRGVRPDEAEPIAGAIVEAGFGAIEVPLNSPEPLDSIAKIALRFGERVLVGAGTVLEPHEVDDVAEAGGEARGRAQRRSRRNRAGGEAWAHRAAGRRHDDRGV